MEVIIFIFNGLYFQSLRFIN